MARRKDEDLVGLFSALNSGTDLSATTRVLSASNATAIIGVAKADKYGTDLRAVFHPNSILRLSRDLSVVGLAQTNQYPIPNGFSASRLQKFWTGVRLGGVPFFETGNITIDANSDGQGAIFNRSALGMLESVSMSRERERDASLRAWEIVMVADYAAFEIDDTKGAPVLVAAGNPATT